MFKILLLLSSLILSSCGGSGNSSPSNDNSTPSDQKVKQPQRQAEQPNDSSVNMVIEGVWKADNNNQCSDGSIVNETRYSSMSMSIKNGIMTTLIDLNEPRGCQKTVVSPYKISVVSRSNQEIKGVKLILGEGRSTYSTACRSNGRKIVEASSVHIDVIDNTFIRIHEAPDRASSCFDLALIRSYTRAQ